MLITFKLTGRYRVELNVLVPYLAQCKGIQIPQSRLGNLGSWNLESWVLKSGIQLKESRIQIPLTNTGIQNPSLTWIHLHGATYLWC